VSVFLQGILFVKLVQLAIIDAQMQVDV
jgi:hypothetical protein